MACHPDCPGWHVLFSGGALTGGQGMGLAAAIAAAKVRHQEARETVWPGEVVIAGQSYVASVETGPRRRENIDGNMILLQTVRVTIRKTLLPMRPGDRTLVVIGGVTYKTRSVGGLEASDAAWELIVALNGEG